ncbi:MAG: FAD-dependent oxidoreductase, partial [Candidatus Saccharibacteria bacterium]
MKNIAIIGAGYTGLSAAYELSKKGYGVDVFEAIDSIGGLTGVFKIEGQSIELAYHHIFTTDKYIINLSKELGSYKYLKWFDSSVAIYQDGQFYPFKTAADLL